jgi:hypothetical protein
MLILPLGISFWSHVVTRLTDSSLGAVIARIWS